MLCLLWSVLPFYAAQVDTLMVKSPSMNKEVQVVVVVPDIALGKKGVDCPVIYLLHGFGGNAKTWIGIRPELPQIADEKGIIFVCPDRRGRAITGLSMGGHGALWNAIRHKDVFGAAGSTSGGVDIRPFPKNWLMSEQLGTIEENRQVWDDHTVINQVDKLQNGDLALIVDCGEADFFLDVNKNLHNRLLELKIDHDFITRPGAHNGEYWNNSIDYQILFFSKFFKK